MGDLHLCVHLHLHCPPVHVAKQPPGLPSSGDDGRPPHQSGNHQLSLLQLHQPNVHHHWTSVRPGLLLGLPPHRHHPCPVFLQTASPRHRCGLLWRILRHIHVGTSSNHPEESHRLETLSGRPRHISALCDWLRASPSSNHNRAEAREGGGARRRRSPGEADELQTGERANQDLHQVSGLGGLGGHMPLHLGRGPEDGGSDGVPVQTRVHTSPPCPGGGWSTPALQPQTPGLLCAGRRSLHLLLPVRPVCHAGLLRPAALHRGAEQEPRRGGQHGVLHAVGDGGGGDLGPAVGGRGAGQSALQEDAGAAGLCGAAGPGAAGLRASPGLLGPGGVLRPLRVLPGHRGLHPHPHAGRAGRGGRPEDGVVSGSLRLHPELCWAGRPAARRCVGGRDPELRRCVLLVCGGDGPQRRLPGAGRPRQGRHVPTTRQEHRGGGGGGGEDVPGQWTGGRPGGGPGPGPHRGQTGTGLCDMTSSPWTPPKDQGCVRNHSLPVPYSLQM